MDISSIHSINANNEISMNDDKILSINIMPHFYFQRTMKMYLQDQNMIQRNEEFIIRKNDFGFIIKQTKDF